MKTLIYLFTSVFIYFYSMNVSAQLPEIQYSGNLSFIAGGIGSEESDAIQAEAKRWPLMLQFSQIDDKGWGSWISEVKIKIFNSQRQEIFNHVCDGPFILLNLKPGEYVIEATYNELPQKKVVVVKPNQFEKLSIYWK